jgi:hypothetical protein
MARPAQRHVHATNFACDEDYYQFQGDTSYGIDTNITKIYANATHTTPGSTSQFLPRDEWLKLTQYQRKKIIAKRCIAIGSSPGGLARSSPPIQRVNNHLTIDHVNIDDIIEYTVNTHLVTETEDGEDNNPPADMLLAHMYGQSTSITWRHLSCSCCQARQRW